MENIISMENIIYQKYFTQKESDKFEFYIAGSNTIEPCKETRELWLTVKSKDIQLDTYFDSNELDSLIDYLQNCRTYIRHYNK